MRIIAGKFKNKPIIAPKGNSTRPTSGKLRETLFNICQTYIEDARFLDLFAGSGAMGFEALSRGAKSAAFIDSSIDSIKSIKKNIEALEVKDQTKVYSDEVFLMLERLNHMQAQFDIIYADPPYGKESTYHGETWPVSIWLLKRIDKNALLAPGGQLFIEDALDSIPGEYETLVLKSSRRMGRSYLHQFEKKV